MVEEVQHKAQNVSEAAATKYVREPPHVLGSPDKQVVDAIPIRQYRETFLLPYMTLETLSKDGPKLLRLLYRRVAHMPEEWVTFDNRQLLLGWFAGAFEEKFNAGCITMYGKSFGRWSPFNKAAGMSPQCPPTSTVSAQPNYSVFQTST